MKKSTGAGAEIRRIHPSLSGGLTRLGEPPSPPAGLSTEARQWWMRIAGEYDLSDQAGQFLLQRLLEAHDRYRQAQRRIQKDGATVRDRFGQLRAHPMLVVERDARSAMLQALKQLALDIDLPGLPGKRGS